MKNASTHSQGSLSRSWRIQKEGILPGQYDQKTNLEPHRLRIAAYVRLSPTGDEREEGSLVSHPQRIKNFVELKNKQSDRPWGEIVDWYIDKDQSGKDLNRPSFQKLYYDIQNGKIDAVIVTELSRLSRRVKDFCHIWDFLKEHDVKFMSLKESFDTSTPMGELMLIQAISFAQFERETIVGRIKDGSRARAERGLANGVLPLGFDLVPGKTNHRQINEEEAAYVRFILKKMLELKKMTPLMKFLNKKGYKTKEYVSQKGVKRGGKGWSLSSLHQLLTNRAYIGQREFNKKNRTKDQTKLKKSDQYFFTKAQWPTILNKDVFFDVQNLLEENKRKARKYAYTYKLTGLVKCSECGEMLCGISGTGRNSTYFYYGHAKSKGKAAIKCQMGNVPAPHLEEVVRERLKVLARDKTLLASIIKNSHSEREGEYSSLKSLAHSKEAQRRDLSHKINGLLDALVDCPDQTTQRVIQDKIAECEATREALKGEIISYKEKMKNCHFRTIDASAVFDWLQTLNQGLDQQPPAVQAQIFKGLVKEIIVSQNQVILKVYGGNEKSDQGVGSSFGSGGDVVNGSSRIQVGGPERDRTADLHTASVALSQLSYGPLYSFLSYRYTVKSWACKANVCYK